MSAIKKAADMLRREAESMKEFHTVGVGGEWYGESAKAEYDEMIAVADAAIAERDELLEALQYAVEQVPELGSVPGISAAIARATGEYQRLVAALEKSK